MLIFAGFWEAHGIIDNSAMPIPLEALLKGVGSISPIRTRDYTLSSERTFPMARLRAWNLMLKGARLVADCSSEELKQEIDNLIVSKPYVPKIVFEKPTGVSQQMQLSSGPWAPQISDETCIEPAAVERVAPKEVASSAEPHAVAESTESKNEDDVEILSSYQQGGGSRSGSGSSSSARATDLPSASVEQPSEPFKLAGLNIARFLAGLDAFAFDILEHKLEQGKMVSRWLGVFGQGFHLSGKPVRQKTNSQQPSSIEPEIFDAFTPNQKKEHISLVKEQKKSLDAATA